MFGHACACNKCVPQLSVVEDNEDGPLNMILDHWTRGMEVWLLAEQCTQHQHRKRPSSIKVIMISHSCDEANVDMHL